MKMNKQHIRNLAEKSGIELTSNGFNVYTEFASLSELEKFAEWIVRECAKSANDWYQNHDKIHSDPMSYVLAHFGVEE